MSFLTNFACSPTSILNTFSGAASMRTAQDVPYAQQQRQKLDRYSANQSKCRIMFVYGGNWREGSKDDYGFVGAQLAKRGYDVSIPDYRLYPQVSFPGFVEDIAAALAFELGHADSEKQKIVMMGHSAGALIAALISLDPKFLKAHGEDIGRISALISLAGPHDFFLPTDNPKWTAVFGDDKDDQKNALPVNHVSAVAPPSLILHGADDDIVTPKSARSMHSALEAADVPSTLKIYPKVGHKRLVAAIGSPLHFLAPTLDDIDHFLQASVCTE